MHGCEPPYGCWNVNSGPSEEQSVLLTAEPSLIQSTASNSATPWSENIQTITPPNCKIILPTSYMFLCSELYIIACFLEIITNDEYAF